MDPAFKISVPARLWSLVGQFSSAYVPNLCKQYPNSNLKLRNSFQDNFLSQKTVEVSKQKHTFALSNANSHFDVVFAQISVKLPKITKVIDVIN